MDIKQLQYLAALVREKHFTRAAAACNVTQPTLSGRIRQLEQELGVPIVERGQRYVGLTPEGERVYKWALHILDSWSSLHQEIAQFRRGKSQIAGRIAIGVIPSALPMAATLTSAIQRQYPDIDLAVMSLTSIEILRSLEEFSIDAGITYIDNESIEGFISAPLYTERYCLFVREESPVARYETITWAEAAQLPLCLLTPNMQNRRIIDAAFRSANTKPVPRVETNSVINLYANVRQTGLAAIIPEYFFEVLGPMPNIRAIPLVAPEVTHEVGLIALDREPLPPLITAILDVVRDVQTQLRPGAKRS
jgi:DNA-binding transcriptional LysR family regulator